MALSNYTEQKRRLSARLRERQMPLKERDTNKQTNGNTLTGAKSTPSQIPSQLKRKIPTGESQHRRLPTSVTGRSVGTTLTPLHNDRNLSARSLAVHSTNQNSTNSDQRQSNGQGELSNGPPKKKKRAAWDTKVLSSRISLSKANCLVGSLRRYGASVLISSE